MKENDLCDLLVERCEILEQHELVTALIKSKDNLKDVIISLRESVIDVSNKLSQLRECLNQLNNNNDSCRKLWSLQQELMGKILDMNKNVPEDLITEYKNSNKSESVESNSNAISYQDISSRIQMINFKDELSVEEPTMMNCKKELFNESEPECPKMSLLEEEEYNKIPKYMIGRQTLDKVNSLVISINKVLKIKYSLLSAGRDAAKKKGQLDTYLNYKKQNSICESCGCKYFFTAEDYENSTKSKLDRAALNMMMALRHCKRIREYRLKKELYYIVLK